MTKISNEQPRGGFTARLAWPSSFKGSVLGLSECSHQSPRWGTADAEINVPSAESSKVSKVLIVEPEVGRNIGIQYSHAFFAPCRPFCLSNFAFVVCPV